MSMNNVPSFRGGAGVTNLPAVLAELQGLTQSLLAGAAANTKIDLAAIRMEDTIIGAINNATGGVLTDVLSTLSIVDTHAVGTITAASVLAADTATVSGRVFTAVGATAVPASNLEFSIGASDTICAANLAAAINAAEANDAASNITATSAAAVVTIRAVADGTAGNAITLATSNARLTKSATTLLGGTVTGGIKSTGATDQLILTWFNKAA